MRARCSVRMNRALRRTELVGLALGAAAGLGLLAFILYRTRSRRRAARCLSSPEARGSTERLPERPDLEELLRSPRDDQEAAAQAQALAAVEAAVQGLSPEQQLELRNQLDQVLTCVSSLRSEVAELRDGLQDIAVQIIQDVKRGVEDSQRVRRRRHLLHRERTDSTSSSSIYFTASQGVASAFEETSEGGYSTAYAESDYTDRDTDKEEGEQEPEQDSDEDQSCATVVTLKLEEEEEEGEVEQQEDQEKECPSGELALLLAQSDVLHTGDAALKAEGYRLLLDNKDEYGDKKEFLWRLARAYRDMYQSTEDKQEKIVYGQLGREEAEMALKRNGLSAECHRWFAVLTGLTMLHEGLHGKLKSTRIFKEHLDRALALTDNDHVCFYLLGRWSYTVATLDWLEKRAAAALHPNPPTASLHDALENFLKAEELRPGFCRNVRLYIAKCYKELNNISEATHWLQQALRTPPGCEDDAETTELENQLQHLTDRRI